MTQEEFNARDNFYPFRATCPGYSVERFHSKEAAQAFFKSYEFTCLLSTFIHGKYKIIAYKYSHLKPSPPSINTLYL